MHIYTNSITIKINNLSMSLKEHLSITGGIILLLACALPGYFEIYRSYVNFNSFIWYFGFETVFYASKVETGFYFQIPNYFALVPILFIASLAIITGVISKTKADTQSLGTLWIIIGIIAIGAVAINFIYWWRRVSSTLIPIGLIITTIGAIILIKGGTKERYYN